MNAKYIVSEASIDHPPYLTARCDSHQFAGASPKNPAFTPFSCSTQSRAQMHDDTSTDSTIGEGSDNSNCTLELIFHTNLCKCRTPEISITVLFWATTTGEHSTGKCSLIVFRIYCHLTQLTSNIIEYLSITLQVAIFQTKLIKFADKVIEF